MLRTSSSVSSGVRLGPSTRCKMPCTRMTGATPTRIWRSEAPSETTNCNKSDIEYDIRFSSRFQSEAGASRSIHIAHGGADHFLRRGEAGQYLADAVFAQCPHAH